MDRSEAAAKKLTGAQVSGALGSVAAPMLIWLVAIALSSDATVLKLVLLGVALSLGGWGAFRSFHPSKRTLRRRSELPPIPEGATLLQRLRFAQEVIQADVLRIADEKFMAPARAQAMNRPYHVARDFGGRLTITPPAPLSGDGLSFGLASLRRKRESWTFLPGMAELTVHRGAEQSKATSYRVDSVEIGHDIWTNGFGVTDHLRIKGPEYSMRTVVALEYLWDFEIQFLHGRGAGGAVSPSLAGSAAESGLPRGVGDAYDHADTERIAPTIFALSRLITDATGRPINVLVGSCRQPDHGD
jgi:hypothetical protein